MVNCNINELSEETRRLHYEVLYRIFKAWLVGGKRLGWMTLGGSSA